MTRIVIADDHPAFVLGLELALTEFGLRVEGTALNGIDAVSAVARFRPDCVLLDVRMPAMSGLEACREIVRCGLAPAVVFVSTYSDPALIREAYDAGARAFLAKDVPVSRVATVIKALASDQGLSLLVPPEMPLLTTRELEVLGLIGLGLSNKRIAAELDISPETVKDHCSTIFAKLDVHDRVAAVVIASRLGLLPNP